MFVFAFLLYLLPAATYACMKTPELPQPPIPITVAPEECPIPPETAMLFVLSNVDLVDGEYGKVDPIQSCTTRTGSNNWYSGDTPAAPDGSTLSAGTWDRTNCAAPCICDTAGLCFEPFNPVQPTDRQNPILTFYPHCPTPTSCFMAVIMSSPGFLNSVTSTNTFGYAGQLDANTDHLPVTDATYLNAKSVGCSGCPVIVL